MFVDITRFAYFENATMGRLRTGDFQCWTLERPWKDNEPFVSCIPDGIYECRPFSGRKFQDVVEICDVPNRTVILIHAANLPSELSGCIAPGLNCHFDSEGGSRVWNSRKALTRLFEVAGKEFVLRVSSQAARLKTGI